MGNPAILIEQVWKTYERGKIRKRDLRSTLATWWTDFHQKKELFNALEEINLRIEHGETLGIVGPNGAGKSTLLKLISRITYPTKGRITINGTLSSMLEVGTGFHPELTGRENIYLNGAILGMGREEVNLNFDSIVSFSGIENFLDTPIKHYSSGMYVRLAFSVASHLEPDILLIDEVMSVGDQTFMEKSLDKILDITKQGRTIVMVSHQMDYLRLLCKHGIYLNEGRLLFQGPIEQVIDYYIKDIESKKDFSSIPKANRIGTGRVRVNNLILLNEQEQILPTVSAGQFLMIRIELMAVEEMNDIEVQLDFIDLFGHLWFISRNNISGTSIPRINGSLTVDCVFTKFPLNRNVYHLDISVYAQNQLCDKIRNVTSIEVTHGMYYETGKLPPQNKGMLTEYRWQIKNSGKI